MNRSVHLALALMVAVATLLLSGLIAWFSYWQRYDQVIDTGERTVRELMQTVHRSAEIAAFTGNLQIANEVVGNLMISEMIAGTMLESRGPLRVAQGRLAGRLMRHELHAPFNREQVVGYLLVAPDYQALQSNARRDATRSALWLFGLTISIGIVVYVAVFFTLSRPLTRLSRQLHEILPGSPERLTLSIDAPRNELYRLTADINNLLATVELVVNGERALRTNIAELEYQLRGMFERASVGIFLMDQTGTIHTSNPAFAELVLHQHKYADWADTLFADPACFHAMVAQARATTQPQMGDLQLASPYDRQWRHVVMTSSGHDRGEACFQGLIYDITERKLGELVMQRQADFDHLTGLHNRRAAEVILPKLLQQTQQGSMTLAVLMMDLDRFKHINDTWGHEAGDKVLIEVAQRLSRHRGEGDFVARLGGDEFLFVLRVEQNMAVLAERIEDIITDVSQWIGLGDGQRDYVGCSIGIALYPQHGRRADELRNAADRAMYEVNRHGRQGYCIYDETASAYSVVRVAVPRPR